MTKKLNVVIELLYNAVLLQTKYSKYIAVLPLVARMQCRAKKRYLFLPDLRIKTITKMSSYYNSMKQLYKKARRNMLFHEAAL